jgi:CRP-like cAMP-binding protein
MRVLATGEGLFHQGNAATAIFAVEAGELRLVRRTFDGRLVTLQTARTGELFAEAALFAEAYHCDAVATVPSRVRVYPKAALRAALHRQPALWERFTASLARQVQALRMRHELRNIRSARERVLQYLALSCGPDGRTVPVEGRLQDMAAELGLTREAFYRALTRLTEEGAIERKPRALMLKKRPAHD